MKRLILMGASLAVFAGAAAYGATGAFFSDSESSTGNTFTAGAIDLKVDSQQHYNGMLCANGTAISAGYFWVPEGVATSTFGVAEAAAYNLANPAQYPKAGTTCSGTWTLKDLAPTVDKFFNFPDVKPGDNGENTVSLHIDNNDAWACVDITNIANNDNTNNTPEVLAGDVTPGPVGGGELGANLNFIVWMDDGATDGWQGEDAGEGDNIWQAGEILLTSGAAPSVAQSYTLAGPPGAPLAGGSTGYVGVAWCAGTWSSIAPGATCDGSTLGNIAQTDSYAADIAFRVEQSRNNPNFTCAPEVVIPVVTTLTLAKAVNPPAAALDSAFTLSANGPTPISGIEGAGAVTNAVITPGVYLLSEVGGPGGELSKILQCSGNIANPVETDNGNGTGSVTIAAGENVVCGFTNNFVGSIN